MDAPFMHKLIRIFVIASTVSGCLVTVEQEQPEQTGRSTPLEKVDGRMSSECGDELKSQELVEGVGSGRLEGVLLERYGLSEQVPYVEVNDNGTFTFSSHRIDFDDAKSFDGERWKGELRLLVEGSMIYEPASGDRRYVEDPCDASHRTEANLVLEENGAPLALAVQQFEGSYLVRGVFPYAPQTETIVLDGKPEAIAEVERKIDAFREKSAVPVEPAWVELEGTPPFDPTPPALPENEPDVLQPRHGRTEASDKPGGNKSETGLGNEVIDAEAQERFTRE